MKAFQNIFTADGVDSSNEPRVENVAALFPVAV